MGFYDIFLSLLSMKNLRQADFIRDVGISLPAIYYWKKRGSTPSERTIASIETKYGVRFARDQNGVIVGIADAGGKTVVAEGEARYDAVPTCTTAKEWFMKVSPRGDYESLSDALKAQIEHLYRSATITEARIRNEADAAIRSTWMNFELDLLRAISDGVEPGDCTSAQ